MPRTRTKRTVALVAQSRNRRHIQQPRVLRSVRSVAGQAALGFDGSMLVHKWAANVSVALGADSILIFSGAQIVWSECAVHVVTIGALDQTLIHPVMDGHIELRLLVGVALIAESGLRGFQQAVVLAVVDAMATDAAQIGPGMG